MIIRLDNVSLGYNGCPVLHDIDIGVQKGEVVGIIGPNASGKSTLIKAISGLLKPSSGDITIDGRNSRSIKGEDMAKIIAVVPQNPSLPSAFSAFELTLMGRTPHLGLLQYESPKDFAIVWKAMEQTSTQHLAERKLGELSGGERQRLVISKALVQEPEVILLDEPTAHLDLNYQIEILNLITNLSAKENITLILALHDLNLAAQYCERLFLLSSGMVFAAGCPEDVITPENIKQVYGIDVLVSRHPLNGLPLLINPVPDREKHPALDLITPARF